MPDRAAAKNAVLSIEDSDPDLTQVLSEANDYKLRLTQEENRHAEERRRMELGWIGSRLLGDENSAPMSIALIVIIACFVFMAGCVMGLILNSENQQVWSTWLERFLAFAGAAVAYVFGRKSSK